MKIFANIPPNYTVFTDCNNTDNYYCMENEDCDWVHILDAEYGSPRAVPNYTFNTVPAYMLYKVKTESNEYEFNSNSKKMDFPINRIELLLVQIPI